MDRRVFLKLTGLAAAASALDALPVDAPTAHAAAAGAAGTVAAPAASAAARLMISTPGIYQITGRVRLDEPQVEISGIGQTQSISWSGLADDGSPEASFTVFGHFDSPGLIPPIEVRGGRLEAMSAAPVVLQ